MGGDVISTVDGHPITLSELAHASTGASVDPAVALSRLQDEEVVARAAQRAGWGADPEVARAERRALVQALLARTVEATEPEIDPVEIERAYEASGGRFDAPERRGGVYVLARTGGPNDEAAARRWIAQAHAEIAAAAEPVAAALAIGRRPLDSLPFGAEVREVELVDRGAGADPAYLEALFALERPGLVPAPVLTSAGWQVIVLTRIEPARSVARVDAMLTLRDERVAVIRAAALAQLVREIARDRPVVVEPNASSLLANLRIGASE